jgi:hypothetical protein
MWCCSTTGLKKKGRCLTSGGGEGIRDPLNTTTSTTNLIMNNKGKTQMMTSSTPWEEGEGDDSSFRFNQTGVTSKNVVLFNNRLDKDGEVLSNGDNLGGNDKMSNDDDNGGSAGDDKDGRGDNGRMAGWEENNSARSNGENRFELNVNDGAEGRGEGQWDNNEDYINEDDNNNNVDYI